MKTDYALLFKAFGRVGTNSDPRRLGSPGDVYVQDDDGKAFLYGDPTEFGKFEWFEDWLAVNFNDCEFTIIT